MVDIGTGIFNVQVPGDYEFHYQGRDVRVLLLFTGYVLLEYSYLIIGARHCS